MDAALIELRPLILDRLVVGSARRNEVGASQRETLWRGDRIPRKLIEERNDAAAEMLHFGECVRLSATVRGHQRLTDERVHRGRGKMPSADGAVRRKLSDEVLERDAGRPVALDVCRAERRAVARVEDRDEALASARYDAIRCRCAAPGLRGDVGAWLSVQAP